MRPGFGCRFVWISSAYIYLFIYYNFSLDLPLALRSSFVLVFFSFFFSILPNARIVLSCRTSTSSVLVAPTTATRYLFTNNNGYNMYFMSLFVHFRTHVSKCSIENRIFNACLLACARAHIAKASNAFRGQRVQRGSGKKKNICARNRITLPDDIRFIILLSANA